jgi:hypothetical protein
MDEKHATKKCCCLAVLLAQKASKEPFGVEFFHQQ